MAKNNLYFYLARLDKKGMEVVASTPHSKKVYPTKLSDLTPLGLSRDLQNILTSEAHKKRMTHVLYAESAESFEDLRKSLGTRGYSNLPLNQFTGYSRPQRINDSNMVTESSSMLKRGSVVRR